MTDKQLDEMSVSELLNAFLNKAFYHGSESVSDKIILKLKNRITPEEYKVISIEYFDSKSLIGDKQSLVDVVKYVQQKYK